MRKHRVFAALGSQRKGWWACNRCLLAVPLFSSAPVRPARHLLHTTYYAPRTWHHAPPSSAIPDEGATWPPRAGILLGADEETTLKHRRWRKQYVGSPETRSHAKIPDLTGCAGSSGMTKKRMGGRSRHGPGSRAQSALDRGFACSSFRLFTDVTPIPNGWVTPRERYQRYHPQANHRP